MSASDAKPPRDQPALSAVAVVAVLLVLPVVALASHVGLLTVPAVLVAALLVGARHDSGHALAALLLVTLAWVASRPDALSPWSLVLAVLMLTTHCAVALRSSLPPGAPPDRLIVLRWLRRMGCVVAVTTAVYLAGIAVHRVHSGGSELVVVLALLVVAVLVLVLRDETVREETVGPRRP